MGKFRLGLGFLLLACLFQSSASAGVMTYYFQRITNNGNPNVASQLSVTVGDVGVGPNQVYFDFRNAVGTASSITDVYFDDGTLLGIASTSSVGSGTVNFASPANPSNLPGGNGIDFNTTGNFSADSNNPNTGVNATGETLRVLFNLISGQNWNNTIAALNLSLLPGNVGRDVTGGLRIGLHVQAIGVPGGSDGYVNIGTTLPPGGGGGVVPEPTSGLIYLLLGATALVGNRFRKA